MLKNKKALAMSVLCAIASVGFVVSASAAEQAMHGNLDEVVVEGSADVLPGGGRLIRLFTLVSTETKNLLKSRLISHLIRIR